MIIQTFCLQLTANWKKVGLGEQKIEVRHLGSYRRLTEAQYKMNKDYYE